MRHLHVALLVFLLSLFCVNVYAEDKETTTVTTTQTQTPEGNTVVKEVKRTTRVITPVPAAKETIATPEGYVSCFKVDEGWYNNVWVPTHQVCKYENTAQGAAWVEGYWECNNATTDGVCTNWQWKAGHWEKTLSSY